jgi:YesN/AraC family two-component response regulator
MGISPWDYLTKLRMEKAVYLMETHTYKLSEVAENVGYTSGNYFNKVFRKTFGTSPGKFELMYQGSDELDL